MIVIFTTHNLSLIVVTEENKRFSVFVYMGTTERILEENRNYFRYF